MEKPNGGSHSHLFTVRVWKEEIGAEQSEWRGKVQQVIGGDVRYFRDWASLAPLLLAMLSEAESEFEAESESEPDKQRL